MKIGKFDFADAGQLGGYVVACNHLLRKEGRDNPKKFPKDYVFTANSEETELVKNFDRFNNLKHSTAPLKAFTEKGLYMLATILKSDVATDTTIAIIEAFAKLRELGQTILKLSQPQDQETQQQLVEKSYCLLIIHPIRPYPLFHQIRGQKAVFGERGTPVGYGVVCYLHDCRHF